MDSTAGTNTVVINKQIEHKLVLPMIAAVLNPSKVLTSIKCYGNVVLKAHCDANDKTWCFMKDR